jgi:hypothetical protein
MENKILLHACCGICSSYPILQLRELGYEPVVLFYNPNIFPKEEYEKRLEAQKILCKSCDCELIQCDYIQEDFFNAVKGFENEPERGKRCDICFNLRLEKTAQIAKNMGIKCFTTSIVISPHKNFQKLSQIGESVAKRYDLSYIAIDFKKKDGFLKTNKIANSLNLYRQNYCGCKFSIRSL